MAHLPPAAGSAPLIVLVAPSRLRVPALLVAFMTIPAILVLLLMHYKAQSAPPARKAQLETALPKIAAMLGASSAVVIVLSYMAVRKINRKPPPTDIPTGCVSPSEPMARALSGVWRAIFRPPAILRVRELLAEHGFDVDQRPAVVGFGSSKVAEASDISFEPEVISPTQRFGRSNGRLLWTAIFITVSLLGPRFIPGFPNGFRGSYLFLGFAMFTAISWVWANTVRVAYLRIAPGMIQVLRYRMFARTPVVRSYPIQPGTLIVLLDFLASVRLRLLRDAQADDVILSRMEDRKTVAELIWRAVRSTAPTPPLSRTELVG